MVVDGVDATADIRGREVTEAVSAVAANTRCASRAAAVASAAGRASAAAA